MSDQSVNAASPTTPPVGQGGLGKFVFGLVLGICVGGLAGAVLAPYVEQRITNESARTGAPGGKIVPGAPVPVLPTSPESERREREDAPAAAPATPPTPGASEPTAPAKPADKPAGR